MSAPRLDDWRVDSLRLTAFSNGVIDLAGQGWWNQFTGSEPELTGRKPQAGEAFESGPYEDGNLQFQTAFNRIDCIFVASPKVNEIPAFEGRTDHVIERFIPAAAQWLSSLEHPFIRLAVGVTATKSVSDRASANSTIFAYTGIQNIDQSNVQQFVVQLAYPFKSASVPDCEIMPLSKWASILATVFSMPVGAPAHPKVNALPACRAEFDVFTPSGTDQVFERKQIIEVIGEMSATVVTQLTNGVRR